MVTNKKIKREGGMVKNLSHKKRPVPILHRTILQTSRKSSPLHYNRNQEGNRYQYWKCTHRYPRLPCNLKTPDETIFTSVYPEKIYSRSEVSQVCQTLAAQFENEGYYYYRYTPSMVSV